MAKCYVMNPLIGMIHQIRVLLDSGGNLSLINNDVTRKIGLPGDTVNINLNVASLQNWNLFFHPFFFLFSVELLDLEQLLAETKEKAEAERTVKARLAAIRQQLNDLRRADNDEPQGADSGSDTEDQPVTKSQIANLFSSSL